MVRWLLRCVGEEVGSISERCGNVCQSIECSDECLEPNVAPDDLGAGDELDADEDLLVDVTSGDTDEQARKKVVHSSTSGQDEIFLKSWYWDEIFLHFIRRF